MRSIYSVRYFIYFELSCKIVFAPLHYSLMFLFTDGIIVMNTVAMAARWIEGAGPHASWDSYVFAICKQNLENFSNLNCLINVYSL